MSARSSMGAICAETLLRQNIIVITPSWHCDAHCWHCFIPIAKRKKDTFSNAVIRATLTGLPDDIRVVSITGGEPFLHPQRLLAITHKAARKKRFTAVVTNGLWFTTLPQPKRLLEKLYRAGLRGVSISIDAYHRPQISSDAVVRLITLVRSLGMAVNIRGAGRQAGKIAAGIMKTGVLRDQENPTHFFGIEHAGCAKKLPADKLCRPEENDYCSSATQPLVLPDGQVLACCTIRALEVKNDVLMMGNVLKEPLAELLLRARRNFIIAALVSGGPTKLMNILGKKISTKEKSRCQLCLEILNDRGNVEELVKRISASRDLKKEIAGRTMVWEKCYRPELLWQFQTGV